MSEVNASFIVDATTITVSPTQTNVSFTPVDNQITFYGAGKLSDAIPAKGTQGQLQYNNGGNLDATPLTSFNNGTLTLGPVSNVSIGGGSSGYVLATDGNGGLSWTHTIADAASATYATSAGNATYANTAGNADIANLATVANLAHNSSRSYGLNATLANTSIKGGLNGYLLTTDGNGALSWSAPASPPTSLANLTDVTVSAPTDGQLLTFNTLANKWIAQNPNSVTGVTKIVAGSGVVLSPTSGVGTVTITATGGGTGNSYYPTGGTTNGNTDGIFWNNDTTVNSDYTIPANKNSMSVGPITIGTGATVTITPGSVWAII